MRKNVPPTYRKPEAPCNPPKVGALSKREFMQQYVLHRANTRPYNLGELPPPKLLKPRGV